MKFKRYIAIILTFIVLGISTRLSGVLSSASALDWSATRSLTYQGETTRLQTSITSYLPLYCEEYIGKLKLKPGVNSGVSFPLAWGTYFGSYLTKSNFESTVNVDYQLALSGWRIHFGALQANIENGARNIGQSLKLPDVTYDYLFPYRNANTFESTPSGSYDYKVPSIERDIIITVQQAFSLFGEGQLRGYRERYKALQESLAYAQNPYVAAALGQSMRDLLKTPLTVREVVTLNQSIPFTTYDIYKSYHSSNKLHIVDRNDLSLLVSKNTSLVNTVNKEALQVNIHVHAFPNTGSPLVIDGVQSTYGTGSRLEHFIKTNMDTLPKKATLRLLPVTLAPIPSTYSVDRGLLFDRDYISVINDADTYMTDNRMNFFRVKYPLKQIGEITPVEGKDGTYLSDFVDIGEIDLVKEEAYISQSSGDIKKLNLKQITGDIDGALTYIPTVGLSIDLTDVGHIQSDRLMECVKIGGEYLPTGRILKLPVGEFTKDTLFSYASSELQSATKPKASCYMFDTSSGVSVFQIGRIDNQFFVGNGIVLNPTASDDSGIFDYFNNIASDDLIDMYGVATTRIIEYLRGGSPLPTGELTPEQIQRINQINSELEKRGISNIMVWVRTLLIILGALLMLYASLMFVGLAFDKGGGIFGFYLIPLLTFGHMKYETSFGSTDNTTKSNIKRIWGTIIGSGLFGIILMSNAFYQLIYRLISGLFMRLGG